MRYGHLYVQGEKPVHNDIGDLCLDERAKQTVWKKALWAPLKCIVGLGPGLPDGSLSHGSSLASCPDVALPTPYSLYTSYKESSTPWTRHCAWLLKIWKGHSIVYPYLLSGGLYTSLALKVVAMPHAEHGRKCQKQRACLVAIWVENSIWKPRLFPEPLTVHKNPSLKRCMQMTWSSYLNC